MKSMILPLLITPFAVFIIGMPMAFAGEYHVNISIIAENLYETSDGTEIETQRCRYQANEEAAIVDYQEGRFENALLFQNKSISCRITKIVMH